MMWKLYEIHRNIASTLTLNILPTENLGNNCFVRLKMIPIKVRNFYDKHFDKFKTSNAFLPVFHTIRSGLLKHRRRFLPPSTKKLKIWTTFFSGNYAKLQIIEIFNKN